MTPEKFKFFIKYLMIQFINYNPRLFCSLFPLIILLSPILFIILNPFRLLLPLIYQLIGVVFLNKLSNLNIKYIYLYEQIYCFILLE